MNMRRDNIFIEEKINELIKFNEIGSLFWILREMRACLSESFKGSEFLLSFYALWAFISCMV